MKRTQAQWEHSTIGFPKVKLKWHETDVRHVHAYVTVNGFIRGDWPWPWGADSIGQADLEGEMERFDRWVRSKYSETASVQG